MAAPSVCHRFSTYIISFVDSRLRVTLTVRVPIDRILRDNEQGSELDVKLEPCSELDVTLEGRSTLQSLQELDELLEESLRSSSHSQEKRNESEFASGIQDLVEPLPQITISERNLDDDFESDLDDDFESDLDDLLELVVKFRTKLHIAFSTPDESAKVLQSAVQRDSVRLAKLAVAMEPVRISNNSCLCPATVVAKVMKCASTLEVVILLLAIRGNLQLQPNIFINPLAYGKDISKSYHENQKLPGVWNLTSEVHGVLLPRLWARTELNAQVLKLQVSLQPVVTGACSMAIGVRNVQVRIQNASLDSLPSNVLGFFLSHITVSIRPEVEGQQVLLMLLEVPSPNEPYDISATRTIGVSATATGSKNPGVAVTATESASATIKSTTTDWRQEQTRGDEFTGNFSWTLRRLAGVPFDYAQPKCTKVSTRMLQLPFNSDGSVTFSEQCLKTIQWTLAPELAGTDVAWYVSATVHVTTLDRSTSTGKTLEFWSPHHFLHNMSTDVECTHS
ncbi:unnamed protein product [Sphagnum compactum]